MVSSKAWKSEKQVVLKKMLFCCKMTLYPRWFWLIVWSYWRRRLIVWCTAHYLVCSNISFMFRKTILYKFWNTKKSRWLKIDFLSVHWRRRKHETAQFQKICAFFVSPKVQQSSRVIYLMHFRNALIGLTCNCSISSKLPLTCKYTNFKIFLLLVLLKWQNSQSNIRMASWNLCVDKWVGGLVKPKALNPILAKDPPTIRGPDMHLGRRGLPPCILHS